jgi:hypothetical protein
MSELNEIETAKVALEEIWRQLAQAIEQARHVQLEATRNPSHLTDPEVDAQLKWLTVFEPDLADIQAVYEAALGGARLSPEELHSASKAGQELMEVIPSPQGAQLHLG